MKAFIAAIITFASIITTVAAVNIPREGEGKCTAECRPVKPDCPIGEAPTGSEGCWGCCQPIQPKICTAECRPVKPDCSIGEAPTGSEGCWGCCQPIIIQPIQPQAGCIEVCRTEKPTCREGEAATGFPGCWGCCKPI